MTGLYTFYLVSLYLSAAISVALAIFIWHRRSAPGAIAVVLLMVAIAEWTLANALQLDSAGLEMKLLLARVQYLGIALIPMAWLIFVLQYIGRTAWLAQRGYMLLCIEPVLLNLLVWTNDFHGWMWTAASVDLSNPLPGFSLTYNTAFWLQAAYSYVLVLVGTFLLLQALKSASPGQRWQIMILLAAVAVPFWGNVVYVLGLSPLPNLDFTPLTFTISSILLAWGVSQYWLFDLIPVARSAVMEGMKDGVIVLDLSDRVIDLNRAASLILGRPIKSIIGQPASQVFSAWPVLVAPVHTGPADNSPPAQEICHEIQLGESPTQRIYDVRISPFLQKKNLSGRLVIWNDVTERRRAEADLQVNKERYRQSVEKSPNPIFSVDHQGLIRSWNHACETTFLYSQDILGRSYDSIVDGALEKLGLDSLIAEVFEQKASFSDIDTSFRCKDSSLRFMTSRLYPVLNQEGKVEACVFANTDITGRKQAEQAMRRQLDELTVLHAVATACVEAAKEDELIESVTRIIGKMLYTDNFGILLLDEVAGVLRIGQSYHGLAEELRSNSIPLGSGITGKVAANGMPRRVADVDQEPGYLRFYAKTRSELCVPIKSGEQMIGVINAESIQPNNFSETDERLLFTLAGQIAMSIKRLRAEAAEQQRIEELLAVTRVSHEITSVLDLQQVLNSIVRHAAELSRSDASGVYAYRDQHFFLVAAHGVGEIFVQAINREGGPAKGTAVGQAVTRRSPVQIPDVFDAPGYPLHNILEIEGIRSILALPLLQGETVIGGIVLWHRQPRRYTTEEIVFLQALAQQSVNAIENARLFEAEHEQRKLAEALHKSASALSATLDLNTLLDRLLDLVVRVVPYDAANVMLVEGNRAYIIRSRGYEQFGAAVANQVASLTFDINQKDNLSQVINTRLPIVISDIQAYPGLIEGGASEFIGSWAGAPVIEHDRVIAIFSLEKIEPCFYRPEHAESLGVFSAQVGLALQNARLFDETQRRLREVTLLSTVITLTASATDLPSALSQVCAEVAAFLQAPQAGFALLNSEGTSATIVAEYGAPGRPSALGLEIPAAGNPSMTYILENKIPLAIADAQTDPRLAPVHHIMRQRNVASIVLVPIFVGDKVAGTLGIDDLQRREFNQADISILQNIAKQIGQVLERNQLFNAAHEHAEQMALLASLSGDLNRPLTVDEVSQGIGQSAMLLGGADRAAVYLRNVDDSISCWWSQGLSSCYVEQVVSQIQEIPGGQVLRQPDVLLISDVQNLPEGSLLRPLAGQEGYRGLGIWPLVYEGKTRAMVACYYDKPHEWPANQKEVMQAFTRQAAIALQNACLFEETRRRAAQQEAVNAVIAAAVSAPDLPSLLEAVLNLTLEALGLEKGSLWVLDQKVIRGLSEDIGEAAASIARATCTDLSDTNIIEDWGRVTEDHPQWGLIHYLARYGIKASLTVPVLAEGKRIGGLNLASSTPRTWLAEEIDLAEAVGQQLGGAVERLRLLAVTQEQAHQLRQIMDTVPEGVLLLGPDKTIVLANPAAGEFLSALNGNSDPQHRLLHLAGQPVEDLLDDPFELSWHELKTPQTPHRVFELAARPIESKQQKDSWVLVLRDVTQERETQARIQMQDRLATVGQLAAGIAHDFNNIMAAIVVYADLLNIEPNLSHASRDRLAIIQKQVQRATSLIRQILDFSRRSVMEQSSLDILPFIKELDKLLARVLPENIRLELAYPPGVYLVNADPTRLQQVFMNLALNARDAMPAGGILHFGLSRLKIGDEDLSVFPELTPGEWVCIEIKDNGTGIGPETMAHIFDPFFTTKPTGQGTGLGLAQVYGIVKQHGGSIDVQSRVNEGTSFFIYLPALSSPETENSFADSPTKINGAGETVLVVEDDEAARDALKAILETQNYRALVASNGLEALKVYELEGSVIDVVVSDVVMPEMGGVALYRALQEKQSRIKMLFITGHPLGENNQAILEEGRVRWLQKPFSMREFTLALQTLLKETT